MKSFLEEYGFAILATIVVILLIMMISPVGMTIRDSFADIVLRFSSTSENSIDNAGAKLDNLLSNIGAGKGDVITFEEYEGYDFIILDDQSDRMLVMLLNGSSIKSPWSTSGETYDFGGGSTALKYAGNDLDVALEGYYETLPESIKDKILPTVIYQNIYDHRGLTEGHEDLWDDVLSHAYVHNYRKTETAGLFETYITRVDNTEPLLIGERHCFAASVKEIVNFLGTTEVHHEDVYSKMFKNGKYLTSIWLRDSRPLYEGRYAALNVNKNAQAVSFSDPTSSIDIRPCFWIEKEGLNFLVKH